MSWLKKPPAKAPETPPRVALELLIAHEQALEAAGHPDPALAYVREHGPTIELDAWGQALPLSDGDQDLVNSLAWVLHAPAQRTLDLLHSGTLDDDDVSAVQAVYPEAYKAISDEALRDLIKAGPPIEPWAECVLSVLFQQPIEAVYSGQQQDEKPKDQQGNPKPAQTGATQADRRDPSVRG